MISCHLSFEKYSDLQMEIQVILLKGGLNESLMESRFLVRYDFREDKHTIGDLQISTNPRYCYGSSCYSTHRLGIAELDLKLFFVGSTPPHCGEYTCLAKDTSGSYMRNASTFIRDEYNFCMCIETGELIRSSRCFFGGG